MVLEIAILDVKPRETQAFEAAFHQASPIIASMPGYVSHELQRCVEHDARYALLVRWQTLEDHTVGFRGSPRYEEWRALLHHFYDPFPTVEHYEQVYVNPVDGPPTSGLSSPGLGRRTSHIGPLTEGEP